MTIARSLPDAIIDLDRKVSRAMEKGKGLTVSPDQLDVFAAIGAIELLAEAKAKVLKEQARCRQAKVVSIKEGNFGSTSPEGPEASPSPPSGISGGMNQRPDTSAARQRAQEIFG